MKQVGDSAYLAPLLHLRKCLLRRALYGLKQALQAWFATFNFTITQDSALCTCQTLHYLLVKRLMVLFSFYMLMT